MTATSAATAPVTTQGATATFGNTSVGTLRDGGMFANYKIVHAATRGDAVHNKEGLRLQARLQPMAGARRAR